MSPHCTAMKILTVAEMKIVSGLKFGHVSIIQIQSMLIRRREIINALISDCWLIEFVGRRVVVRVRYMIGIVHHDGQR